MKPVDEEPMPPPPSGVDKNYLTQDIESQLFRSVLDLVDDEARNHGVGRRRAAMMIIKKLGKMREAQ